jgi:hypothetical protein
LGPRAAFDQTFSIFGKQLFNSDQPHSNFDRRCINFDETFISFDKQCAGFDKELISFDKQFFIFDQSRAYFDTLHAIPDGQSSGLTDRQRRVPAKQACSGRKLRCNLNKTESRR